MYSVDVVISVTLSVYPKVNFSYECYGYVIHTYPVLLPEAVTNEHKEIAKLLIKSGSDLNQTSYLKQTPLHEAVRQGECTVTSV
jgi:hypothetical protein